MRKLRGNPSHAIQADPRQTAEAHVKKLRKAGTVTSATYDGIVYLNKDKTLAGVCFKLEIVVNGRPFANKEWYVTVRKVNDAWQVVPITGDGAELTAGVPKGMRDRAGAGTVLIPAP